MLTINTQEDKNKKIGEISYNTNGTAMEILEFRKWDDITIKFSDGSITKTSYGNFKNGCVRSLYDKTVCGLGYTGEGIYNGSENGVRTKRYVAWGTMLKRCYSEVLHGRQPSYIGCSVCEEWHNYQTFSKWYCENIYQVNDEIMQLDKDILHKGNKVYSPENCVFVPQRINLLFLKREASRGEYPLGIVPSPNHKKFTASCHEINLGTFNTIEEAFSAYKNCKENLIKQVADEYIGKIPQKLYDAMYKHTMSITD